VAHSSVAHHRAVSVPVLAAVSATWERLREEVEAVPGWSWPRCGQKLEFVSGRSAVDAIRVDGDMPPRQRFEALSRLIQARLASGEDAIVDVGSLAVGDIDRLGALVPSDIEVVHADGAPVDEDRQAA
jgi:hypothetical protein